MSFRLLSFKVLLFASFCLCGISDYRERTSASHFYTIEHDKLADKISVRESSSELHVAVGDRIFVFGKSKGTLDKVKVGMHVLPFSQATDEKGIESIFSKVSWKKLKDGSIQIQSSYNPWPKVLTWTVFSNGKLKMEASSPPDNFLDSKWLGLGFNFPDQLLQMISWNSNGADFGQWQNMNYRSMDNQEIKIKAENQGVFQPIRTVRMEFEEVVLEVSTETSGVFFGFGEFEKFPKSNPIMNAGTVFLFNQPVRNQENTVQSPSGETFSKKIFSQDPLVLWFHFQ